MDPTWYDFAPNMGPNIPPKSTQLGLQDVINVKTVKYVDEILFEALEKKIEPIIDINTEISNNLKPDQISSESRTH